ncbi:MAG: crotonase/enoyl-CoA hydratase family protein [Deltaproteobacteria bacterium]|nr:MAG: crotonase/enoyl-CoA hydratase family protein [Deltaproteobacteria bacterium]
MTVHYEVVDRVATIRLDDGKRNALSDAVLAEVHAAFDRAEAEGVAVVLTGRDGVLSAGFDLRVMRGGGLAALRMLKRGYSLTGRMLAFPYPVVVACPGHAYAMGSFLLVSGDYCLAVPGDYTLVANEVAIGLTLPRVGGEVLRQKLTPGAFQRAAVLSEAFSPEEGLAVGFVDELVPAEVLLDRARAKARELLALDPEAHAATKLRVRAGTLAAISRGLPRDLVDAVTFGVRMALRGKKPATAG